MMDNENNVTLLGNWHALADLAAPIKIRGAGRPTMSREKASCEGLSKRKRFCSICKRPGHKQTTCPESEGTCRSSLASQQDSSCILGKLSLHE